MVAIVVLVQLPWVAKASQSDNVAICPHMKNNPVPEYNLQHVLILLPQEICMASQEIHFFQVLCCHRKSYILKFWYPWYYLAPPCNNSSELGFGLGLGFLKFMDAPADACNMKTEKKDFSGFCPSMQRSWQAICEDMAWITNYDSAYNHYQTFSWNVGKVFQSQS